MDYLLQHGVNKYGRSPSRNHFTMSLHSVLTASSAVVVTQATEAAMEVTILITVYIAASCLALPSAPIPAANGIIVMDTANLTVVPSAVFDTSATRVLANSSDLESTAGLQRDYCQNPGGDRPAIYCPDRRPICCYDRNSYEYYCCPYEYSRCCDGSRSGCCRRGGGGGGGGEYGDNGGDYGHHGGGGGGHGSCNGNNCGQ